MVFDLLSIDTMERGWKLNQDKINNGILYSYSTPYIFDKEQNLVQYLDVVL